jgi:hypothetical protein
LNANPSRRDANKRRRIVNDIKRQAMTKTLTTDDIRDLLTGFSAAIELDQIRVDALPAGKFHPYYSSGMWRRWRRYHLDYINQLLPTVNGMPATLLQELTRVALTRDPLAVREKAIELFSSAASGDCPEQFETASLFFGWLIVDVSRGSEIKPTVGDARSSMMRWLSTTDPLRIAEDPECGGQPVGFVS